MITGPIVLVYWKKWSWTAHWSQIVDFSVKIEDKIWVSKWIILWINKIMHVIKYRHWCFLSATNTHTNHEPLTGSSHILTVRHGLVLMHNNYAITDLMHNNYAITDLMHNNYAITDLMHNMHSANIWVGVRLGIVSPHFRHDQICEKDSPSPDKNCEKDSSSLDKFAKIYRLLTTRICDNYTLGYTLWQKQNFFAQTLIMFLPDLIYVTQKRWTF